MQPGTRIEDWMEVRPQGLYCVPAGCYVDPHQAVEKAIITHGHADHARPGNAAMLATQETIAIAQSRYGANAGQSLQPLDYHEALTIGDVTVRLIPAGHILGSAQAVLEHKGERIIVSGDYKRRPDPTCAPFEVVTLQVGRASVSSS